MGNLPKLKPVKFPSVRSSTSGAYASQGSKAKSTSSVVAEMKRLSKKDIYPAK